MDLKGLPPSKNFEDRTGQVPDAMLRWIMAQPTSRGGLTKREEKLLKDPNVSVTDLYFRRAVRAQYHNIPNKGAGHPHAPTERDDFLNEYGMGADHPFKKVK